MAVETNALQTYDMTTNREDLSDVMTLIAQEETPFVSNVGTADADATMHEWPEQTLQASDDTAIVEANTTAAAVPQAPARRRNVTMIRERVATVSGTQEAVDSAGIEGMMDHAVALKLREIKRDIEKCAVGSARPLVVGADGTARVARAFPHFISTALAGNWAAGANDTTAATPGAAVALTEAHFTEVMRETWVSGQVPSLALMAPSHLEAVGAFVGRVNSTHEVAQNAVNLFYVEIIRTPYGALKCLPNPQMPTGATKYIVGLSPKFAAVAWLRKTTSTPMAIVGDYRTKMVNCEFTFECKSEKAHFLIGNLS